MEAIDGGDVSLPDGSVPHPDHPGWFAIPGRRVTGFSASLGELIFRPDGPGRGICRIFPTEEHLNPGGSINGGAVLTLIDWSLFAGGICAGMAQGHYVTLDLHNHFVGRGRAGRPLDSLVTLVRETGSFAFLQGTCVQGDDVCSNWIGTLKRVRPPR